MIGHKRRFAEAIAQIDNELEYASGAVVAARRDEVVAAARAAYGPSEDFRGVRDAWDADLSRRQLQRRRTGSGQAAGLGVVVGAQARHRVSGQGRGINDRTAWRTFVAFSCKALAISASVCFHDASDASTEEVHMKTHSTNRQMLKPCAAVAGIALCWADQHRARGRAPTAPSHTLWATGSAPPHSSSHLSHCLFPVPKEHRCTPNCYGPSPEPDMTISSTIVVLGASGEPGAVTIVRCCLVCAGEWAACSFGQRTSAR